MNLQLISIAMDSKSVDIDYLMCKNIINDLEKLLKSQSAPENSYINGITKYHDYLTDRYKKKTRKSPSII